MIDLERCDAMKAHTEAMAAWLRNLPPDLGFAAVIPSGLDYELLQRRLMIAHALEQITLHVARTDPTDALRTDDSRLLATVYAVPVGPDRLMRLTARLRIDVEFVADDAALNPPSEDIPADG